jgi:1,4-dihydroxy-2-naphthoyl-CoA synthase
MLLNDTELDLMVKHDIDEIIFSSRKVKKITYNIPQLLEAFQKESIELKKQALKQALSQED